MTLKPTVTLAAVLATGIFAQPTFEVATIKPTDPDQRARVIRMQSTNRFTATGFTLQAMVAAAYNLTPRAISGGPAWTDSDRYDILATTPGNIQPNLDEQMVMLRKLLTERFQLTFHREAKEFPIYSLTVSKGGSKLKPSAEPPNTPPYLVNTIFPEEKGGVHVQLPARNATMTEFAAMMQRAVVDRPMVDNTGLSGSYDFELEWTPDETQFSGNLPRSVESTKPSLFSAIQDQLGLKFEATRGPVSALVIDRVERPSEN